MLVLAWRSLAAGQQVMKPHPAVHLFLILNPVAEGFQAFCQGRYVAALVDIVNFQREIPDARSEIRIDLIHDGILTPFAIEFDEFDR